MNKFAGVAAARPRPVYITCLTYLTLYALVVAINLAAMSSRRANSQAAAPGSEPRGDSSKSESTETSSFPVVVLMLGHGFEWSAGHLYDGSVLASYGKVIVVTFNFRLGRLGECPQDLGIGNHVSS
jgi:hypothetical protein